MLQTGQVRRTDFYLRTEYPDLETIIYRLPNERYEIYCDGVDGDFDEFSHNFDNSIKMISAPVVLTAIHPEKYIDIIPQISDKEISKGFEGIGLTSYMFSNLLIAKFPKINFSRIEQQENRTIIIYTAKFTEEIPNGKSYHFLSLGDKKKLEDFLDTMKMPVKFIIIDEQVEKEPELSKFGSNNPIQTIEATKIRKQNSYDFSRRDEALWFDKIDNIFDGSFTKNDLYFYNPNEYSCYVDYSAFNNIDLRNHLLLFQTVYLTLPYDKGVEAWLKAANITKNEFLDLITRGRIKLVLTQPEFRYDLGFIIEAFAANPNGVITRRAISALHQIDLVEMSDNYILNDIKILKELKPFCQIAGEVMKVDPKFFYDLLVWPIKARRDAFEPLLISGASSTSVYGVNNIIEKRISESVNRDLSFEFTVNASSIHLANSLNATYFPFRSEDGYSDQYYANVMGDLLNFYKSATTQNIASFIESKDKFNSGVIPINPIDIIQVNDFITITELEATLSKGAFFPENKNLLETLAPMSVEERFAKIKYYNEEVVKNLNSNKITPTAIDLGTNIIVDSIGLATGLSFLGTAYSMMKLGGKGLNKVANISEKLEKAFNDNPDKANIHYLTKINRVAKLRGNI